MVKEKNVRYELLKINNTKRKIKNKKRILKNVEEFLDGKRFGVLLVSEVDKKGNDIIKALGVNCDVIYSREIVKCLIDNLPGVKGELEEMSRKEFGNMVS